MTTPSTATIRPLPLSGIALLLAYAAGALGYAAFGWLLFALGVVAWMKIDGRLLARLLTHDEAYPSKRIVAYSLPPALALAAYLVLAADHIDLVVSCALAFHALLVWGLLMGSAYPVPSPNRVSHRI